MDAVTNDVEENIIRKLDLLSDDTSDEVCIPKVDDQLRSLHPEAYEPTRLAIGPYNHGKDSLKAMEELKLRYLRQLLSRSVIGERRLVLKRYRMAVELVENEARKCYSEKVKHLDSKEFVKIMLVDGCFILELFLKIQNPDYWSGTTFVSDQLLHRVKRDLILLENQIPFDILTMLLWAHMDTVGLPVVERDATLTHMALGFLRCVMPNSMFKNPINMGSHKPKHLLGLVHCNLCPSFVDAQIDEEVVDSEPINSATELQEFGVQFKRAAGKSLFDIQFKEGVLEIPSISMDEQVDCLLKNLLAYEQQRLPARNQQCYVRDYLLFMDCLINTMEDVQLLRQSGIIQNQARDDAMVYAVLNKLDKHIPIDYTHITYSSIFRSLKLHCKRPRNVTMAHLRREYIKPLWQNYFTNPWAFVSFLAAVLLLVLTIIQTVFAVKSCGN